MHSLRFQQRARAGSLDLLAVAFAAAVTLLLPRLAPALDLPPLRAQQPPGFLADLVISLDAEERPALEVSISLPHSELQWVLAGDGDSRQAARVELAVVFESTRESRLRGDIWERRIVVAGIAEANSSTAMLVEKRKFSVPPGRCRVRVVVRDLNSGAESRAEQGFEVPDYSRVPVGFADLELGRMDSINGFQALPTRRFGAGARGLAARVTLFDRRPGAWPRRYTLAYRIRDEGGVDVLSGTQDVTLARSGEPVILEPAGADLFLGAYVLEVELAQGRSRWRVDRSFEVEESGPPRGREFERMLEPLSYIASSEELQYLRSLDAADQEYGWREFWRRRDPTPDTPRNEAQIEFFRRVRYADQHFKGFGPGWRSDMGRIYIKFGPPEQIETRPGTAQMPHLEIWHYNQPYRRFVFADREGFGRFTLISPGIE